MTDSIVLFRLDDRNITEVTEKRECLSVKPSKNVSLNCVMQQHQSRLLQLPPEIRNAIYELCFSGTIDTYVPGYTPLFTATPPGGKTLLYTCKRVYKEAIQLYQTIYGEYWTRGSFYAYPSGPIKSPPRLDYRGVDLITRLRVVRTESAKVWERRANNNWRSLSKDPILPDAGSWVRMRRKVGSNQDYLTIGTSEVDLHQRVSEDEAGRDLDSKEQLAFLLYHCTP